MIAAHNVARYVRNKADIEALEIPVIMQNFLTGFADNNDDDK